jgi:hypothetical protein
LDIETGIVKFGLETNTGIIDPFINAKVGQANLSFGAGISGKISLISAGAGVKAGDFQLGGTVYYGVGFGIDFSKGIKVTTPFFEFDLGFSWAGLWDKLTFWD